MRPSARLLSPLLVATLAGAATAPHAAAPAPRTSVDAAVLAAGAAPDAAAKAAGSAQDDVDAFMARVLEKREINWDQTYNYVFEEVERLRIHGADIAALQSFDQEYTWYVRDGYLVRSPWKVNGVAVGAEKREADELAWIAAVQNNEDEARIERDSFFDFEFEPGNYLFAGREVFEERNVVRIEYYPTNLLSDDESDASTATGGGDPGGGDPEGGGGDDPDEDFDEEELEHMFDKTSLVTLLVLPEEHQIVMWTFENVGFDFLPYRWLVRMDELRASMVMDQPIEGVWLPREIRASAAASTASFNLRVDYSRQFGGYKEPAVGAGVVFGRPIR